MENEYHNRFKGADWYGVNPPVLIGGAGGTGSWLALLLTRMGLTTVGIYDSDNIEYHNLAGQCFTEKQINYSKVDAVRENCKLFTATEIYTYNEMYTEKSRSANIMFACFDNMSARKIMFNKWKSRVTRELFVDIRLDFEQVDIFFVTPENEERYEKDHLFSDSEVTELQCTMKQTTHVAILATSLAVSGFTNFLAKRDVPFHQTYVIPLNYYSYER